MYLKGQKILVTGGSGFIGSFLVKELRKLEAEVDIYSRSFGLDIRNRSQLKKYINRKYDVIYHLAGYSGSHRSNRNKSLSFLTNTLATIELCDLIVNISPKTKLILAGSRLEYGLPQYLPVDEKHPTMPISIYGLTKLAATQAALGYFKKNNLDVRIIRTSNVYGSLGKNNFNGYNVISSFINQALRNENLIVYGTGTQMRDYIYMDDLIKAFIKVLISGKQGEIYNLGFGEGIKFVDMVKLIIRKVGQGKLKFENWPKAFEEVETGSYISDIKKIKKELNFSPKITFEEGIKKTLEAYD